MREIFTKKAYFDPSPEAANCLLTSGFPNSTKNILFSSF